MRFNIGDKVLYHGTLYSDYTNKTGTLIYNDRGSVPYLIKFEDGRKLWFVEDDVSQPKNKVVIDIIKDL